jgi:N-acetylneuraminic acid mutarotase
MRTLQHTLIVLFCMIAFIATAQNAPQAKLEFKTLKNMPYRLVWPATVTDGRFIYAINGFVPSGGFTSNTLRYDPLTDQWATFNNSAGYKFQVAAAYTSDGNAYLFGGRTNGKNVFRGVQSINMGTGNTATLDVSNPIAATYASAATWNNKIYLFGGTQSGKQTLSSLYQFDPQSQQFTQLADMPEHLQAAGTIVNGTLYTFGGYDEFLHRGSQSINAYDIKTNKWRVVGKLPVSVSANSVAASDNLIFVVGNYDDETFLGYFDVNTQKFTQLKSNMEGRRAAGVAIVDNKLYVFGGTSKFHREVGGMSSVQVADISSLVSTYSASK